MQTTFGHFAGAIVTMTLSLCASSIANAEEASLWNGAASSVWVETANLYGIDPHILYGVALREARTTWRDRKARPHPYTIRVGRHVYRYDSQEEAVEFLTALLEHNPSLVAIDVGLLQLNLHWQGHRVSRPTDLLDPLTNLRAGAEYLAETLQSAPNDLALGIGRYHTWANEPAAREYGAWVVRVACQIGGPCLATE